jgi:hypothetical protein
MLGYSGRVHQNVESAKILFRLLHHLQNRVRACYVYPDGQRTLAGFAGRASSFFRLREIDISNGNLTPVFGKPDGDAPAEARSSARN